MPRIAAKGLWVGLSDGTKFNASQWATWDTYQEMKVLAGDFNGDGKTDVMKFDVPSQGTSQAGLWVGLSDGTKFNTSQWATWDTYQEMKVLAGDFNGDGKTDVMKFDVPSQGTSQLGLWVGLSDGTKFNTSEWATWDTYQGMIVLTGDFNGDGKTDVMKIDVPSQGTSQGGLWVGLSDGAKFNTSHWATWDSYQGMIVLTGDFNGDGKTDVMKIDVPSQGTSQLGLWVGLSDGTKFNTSQWATWDTYQGMIVLTGDFNGDGKTDVMKIDVPSQGTSQGGLWVGLSDGAKFNTSQWATWDTYRGVKVLVGDFNGDGKTDVMKFDVPSQGTSQGGLWVGLSDGAKFNTSQWATWDTYQEMKVLAGDFNGDGRTDVMKFDIPSWSEGMSSFNPPRHGFKFDNQFTNDVIPALDVRTSGLCGGMSYAALDYYFSQMPIPKQPFRPANGTTLHSYLYDRQVTSIESNLDKWAEIGFNPGGVRNTEFFNWGISAKKGERIDELQQFFDNATPCVLGLQSDGSTGNHQVIAFGYTMGRYLGDLGAHVEDFKIYICDPNYPNSTRTLVADTGRQIYHYQEGSSETWRTYFVDKNYHVKQPPAIPNANYPMDNLVYELVLDFLTGGDDLRGGNDNVDLVVNLTDGTQQTYRNINLGARWVVNNDESAEVVLQRAVRQEELRSLVVSTTFGGGPGGDNWDMSNLIVSVLGGGFFRSIKNVGFKRFAGEDKTLTIPINDILTLPGQVNKLHFTFRTGGDDLRGVNDNVNLTIHFHNGQTQRIENANGGHRWADNTTSVVDVDLNRAVMPADIAQIDLDTTFGGGIGGDNWNMDSVQVIALGDGVDEVIFTYGFKRFTGSDKTLTLSHP